MVGPYGLKREVCCGACGGSLETRSPWHVTIFMVNKPHIVLLNRGGSFFSTAIRQKKKTLTIGYCGVPDPPCLSKMPFILPDMLAMAIFNGLKGLGVSSCQRSGSGFQWRPRFPGTRQYNRGCLKEKYLLDPLSYPLENEGLLSRFYCNMTNMGIA